MALFKKKEDKKDKAGVPKKGKAAAKVAPAKQPKLPKQPKPKVPANVYTLLLGLAALFFVTATVVLGLNYYWYQSTDPAVLPLSSWAR